LTPKQYARTQATAEATKSFLERCKRKQEEEATQQEAEAARTEEQGEWVCEACTYLNSSGAKCEICEAAKPQQLVEEEGEEKRKEEIKDGGEKADPKEKEEKLETEKEKEKEKEDEAPGDSKQPEVETDVKERYYTCRMCGYRLCEDHHILPHEPGSGKSFGKRKG